MTAPMLSIDLTGNLYDKKDVYMNSLRGIPEVKDVTLSSNSPIPTSTRASILAARRPVSMVVTRLPNPRGAMMRPAVSTG